jgi:hypothetical protein
MTREFAWILGALGVLIALEYALGIEPRSTESWLLGGAVLLGVALISVAVSALRRDR